jgi:hypothetical protein
MRKLTIAFRSGFSALPKKYDDGGTANGVMAMSNVGCIPSN